jgi:hypothetical protein
MLHFAERNCRERSLDKIDVDALATAVWYRLGRVNVVVPLLVLDQLRRNLAPSGTPNAASKADIHVPSQADGKAATGRTLIGLHAVGGEGRASRGHGSHGLGPTSVGVP